MACIFHLGVDTHSWRAPFTLVSIHIHGVRRPDGDVAEEAEAIRHLGVVGVGALAIGPGMVPRRADRTENVASLSATSVWGGVSGGYQGGC